MIYGVLNEPHQWFAAALFMAFGLYVAFMAWRTWHGKPPLPVRARGRSADFIFGVNTFGRFMVMGNLPIASFSLSLPIFLTILHFNEGTDSLAVSLILWPLEIASLLVCVLSGFAIFTLALFTWPKFLIPPKWRDLPSDKSKSTGAR